MLKTLGAVPVQRNNGIDGLLCIEGTSVAIKIQTPYETLQQAKNKLVAANKTKNCAYLVLIRTNSMQDLFATTNDETPNLLVIDCYELAIKDWINRSSLSLAK